MKTNKLLTIAALISAGVLAPVANAGVVIYSSGTFTGTTGTTRPASGGEGGAGLTLTSASTIITGGTFTGGIGGTGNSTMMLGPVTPGPGGGFFGGGPITMPGTGGRGGAALLVSGGELNISGGAFSAGTGGTGTPTQGPSGFVLRLGGGSQTVISGGTFGSSQTFSLIENSTLRIEGDFGSLNNTTLFGESKQITTTFTGTLLNSSAPASFSFAIAPGSSITFIPEPSAAILTALSSLALLRRYRK